jgi:hypothetical protein
MDRNCRITLLCTVCVSICEAIGHLIWPRFNYDSMDDSFKIKCEIHLIIPVQAEPGQICTACHPQRKNYKKVNGNFEHL